MFFLDVNILNLNERNFFFSLVFGFILRRSMSESFSKLLWSQLHSSSHTVISFCFEQHFHGFLFLHNFWHNCFMLFKLPFFFKCFPRLPQRSFAVASLSHTLIGWGFHTLNSLLGGEAFSYSLLVVDSKDVAEVAEWKAWSVLFFRSILALFGNVFLTYHFFLIKSVIM